jgi:hypothetical protein
MTTRLLPSYSVPLLQSSGLGMTTVPVKVTRQACRSPAKSWVSRLIADTFHRPGNFQRGDAAPPKDFVCFLGERCSTRVSFRGNIVHEREPVQFVFIENEISRGIVCVTSESIGVNSLEDGCSSTPGSQP